MSDDLDLRGIDQPHELDPQFRAALRRRVEEFLAATDPGSETKPRDVATIDLEPSRPQPGPRRRSRRVARGVLAIAVAAAVATTLVVISRDNNTAPGGTPIPTAIANGWVAFAASDVDHESDIYLAREGSDPRRITGSDTDATDEICPAFSPDASQLVFGRAAGSLEEGYHGAALVVADVAADGELSEVATIPLDEEAPPPCGIWSPDGRWVAFGVDPPVTPGSVSGAGLSGREPTSNSVDAVWVVDTQSDDVRRLTVPSVTDFDWAPDDTELAMASDGVVVYSVTADELHALGDAQDVVSVAWSPDGQTIAYMRDPSGFSVDTGDLWLMDADGTNERILVPEIVADHGLGPVWSPDGERIAFQRRCTNSPMFGSFCREETEVVLLTVNEDEPLEPAGSQVVIPAPQTTRPEGQPLWWYPFSVIWSPDGTELLYLAWSEATNTNNASSGIVAVSLDAGTPPVVLSGDLGFDPYSGFPWLPIQSWGSRQAN